MEASLSPSLLQTLTDVAAIRERLQHVDDVATSVDADLVALAQDLADVPSVGAVSAAVTELVATVPAVRRKAADTIAAAEEVVDTTRRLDVAQRNVQAALERVEDILDLKSCLSGVQLALQQNNLQSAAAQLKRFRAVEALVPVLEEDAELMRKAEDRLCTVVEEQFQRAISENDFEAVTSCCQLLNVLGQAEAGLDRYEKFLSATLRAQLASVKHEAARGASAGDPAATVNLVSALFRSSLSVLQEAEAVARDNFQEEGGPERVLSIVHRECEARAAESISSFMKSERMAAATQRSGQYLDEASSAASAAGTPRALTSPRAGAAGTPRAGSGVGTGAGAGTGANRSAAEDAAADAAHSALLTEVALVIQRCVAYSNAIEVRAAALPPAAAATFAAAHCELAGAVAELSGVYTRLEEGFLLHNLAGAIAVDEVLEDGLYSSVVEESFYVFQQSGMRAFATGNVDCGCGAMNHLVHGMESILYRYVSSTVKPGADNLPLAVNNAELCEQYTTQLVGALQSEAKLRYAAESKAAGMVDSCISDFALFSAKFKRLGQAGLSHLRDALVPGVNSALTAFKGESSLISYDLSEADFTRLQELDVFSECRSRLEEVLERFLGRLSQTLYIALVSAVAVYVSKQLEKLITFKKFTMFGGVQFDKDMRSLISFFVERSNRTVRSKLSRLTQLSRLLSLESPDELLEYWGANEGPIPWEFNAAEARRILRQRVDFDADSIARLAL